jgi:hypothetical protein
MPQLLPLVDLRQVRVAQATSSSELLVRALIGARIRPALHQVGTALLVMRATSARDAHPALDECIRRVHDALADRGADGDAELRELLGSVLRGEPAARTPVDLDELTTYMEDRDTEHPGAYVHRRTGEVVPAFAADEAYVGDDAVVDVESAEWVYLLDEGRGGWEDMADFVDTVDDAALRARLDDAIRGRGAFSRFRRVIHEHPDELSEWLAFSDDRRWGRARLLLSLEGIRT